MKQCALLVLVIALAISAMAQTNAPALKSGASNKLPAKRPTPTDIPTSVAASVSDTLQFIEGSFLGVAAAMPEDKYDFIPTAGNFEGVRSFAEQVKHVACAQYAFFNEFEGWKPPTIAKMAATTLRCCRVAQKCPSKWATS